MSGLDEISQDVLLVVDIASKLGNVRSRDTGSSDEFCAVQRRENRNSRGTSDDGDFASHSAGFYRGAVRSTHCAGPGLTLEKGVSTSSQKLFLFINPALHAAPDCTWCAMSRSKVKVGSMGNESAAGINIHQHLKRYVAKLTHAHHSFESEMPYI